MNKSRKGFTLVELVVVITIIGILASIVVPTSLHFVKKANISKELQQMDIADIVQNVFVTSNSTPFDISETAEDESLRFSSIMQNFDIPKNDLGQIILNVKGNGDNWIISFSLLGRKYGQESSGSVLKATLLNTYSNEQVFKGCTNLPEIDSTYIFTVDEIDGSLTIMDNENEKE